MTTGGDVFVRLCSAASAVSLCWRVMLVQRVTKAGLTRLGPTIVALAQAEGLTGHAESIEVRLR